MFTAPLLIGWWNIILEAELGGRREYLDTTFGSI